MSREPAVTVVIPTLGRPAKLTRVLARLEDQDTDAFEVVVVADAKEDEPAAIDSVLASRPFPSRRLTGRVPGASSARNVGWRAAAAPLILFIDDDVLPAPALVSEHIAWHDRHPEETVGVLGDVRWSPEIEVTPFMRWLEGGIQFDYARIDGDEAGWGRFYTANVSVKRTLIERVGGFDEQNLPYGYEDLDLALRMNGEGFRLLYNRAAWGEHIHEMSLDMWRRRVRRIARAERQFMRLHEGFEPYFHRLFTEAARRPRSNGRAVRMTGLVPRRLPVFGPAVWDRADLWWRQQLAEPFLDEWEKDASGQT